MAIYKIFRASEWAAFVAAGSFAGSADDLRDGFLHLSTKEQLQGTLEKHFSGAGQLVVAEVDVANDPALRLEPSRGDALFPHLYRPLLWADVLRHQEQAACAG